MAIKDYGNLFKLTIKNMVTSKEFKVMFNPESYTETFSNIYRTKEDVNTGMEEYVYVKTKPQDFKLKIIIDGTGVTNFNSLLFPVLKNMGKSVYDQVNEFLKLAWYPEEGQVKPLLIQWGDFSYYCFLKDVTINYTLFDRKGHPLRAELDGVFVSNPDQMTKQLNSRFDLKPNQDQTSPPSELAVTSQPKKDVSPRPNSVNNEDTEAKNGIVISVS